MAHIAGRDHDRVNVDRIILDGHHAKDGNIHIDSEQRLEIRADVKVASDKKFLMNNIYDENENVVLTTGGGSATLGVPLDLNNKTISNASGISIEASQVNKSTNSQLYNDLAGELGNLHSGVSDVKNAVFDLGTSNRGKIIVVGNPSNDMEVGGIEADNIITTTANKTITGTLTMGGLTADKFLKLNGSKQIITSDVSVDFNEITGGLAVGQIPDLPASKITEGAFADDRIPNLNASKITAGTIADARLPTNIVRTDTADQTITSTLTIDGGTGDSVLTLKADSDNSNELDNAFIKMVQDGGAVGSGGTRFTVGLDGNNDLFMGCDSDSGFFGGVVLQTNGTGTGTNQKPIIFKPQLAEACRIDQNGINLSTGKTYKINGTQIDFDDLANSGNIDSARLNTEINATIIPNLDTAKITTGTLDNARLSLDANAIPALPASKITSGTLGVDRIPALSANKITSDTLGADRIPSLSANKITSDTLGADRIPSLSANKITSDTLGADRIPTLSANKIGSDTLSIDRIPTITDAKLPTNILRDDVGSQTITNTAGSTELNIKVRNDVSNYNPVLKLSKHNNSDVLQEQLTMTLTDTALESNTDTAYIYKVGTTEKLRVSGSSVKINDTLNINDKIQLQGANPGADSVIQVGTDGTASFVAKSTLGSTSASDLDSGTLSNSLLSLDANTIPNLPASKITSGTLGVDRIPALSANKITSDTLGVDRIPALSANKITSDTLGVDRIPALSANKITSDTLGVDRIPNLSANKITSDTLGADRIPSLSANKITSDTLGIDRIPTLTADKLPTTIPVDRITFNQASSGTDSTTSPSIHDFGDSLIFDVNAGERYSFKVNNAIVGEINADGLHDFIHSDLKAGGEYKIDGTQINFGNIANSGNIDSARLNTEISDTIIPNLSANKITSDTLGTDRIPNLSANKITSDTLGVDRIPALSANKITSDTLSIDRIPQLTEAKLPDTITVDRIKFNQASSGTDSTTSPSIHDFGDSLIFDVNAGERYSYKVNNSIVGEINSDGLHDFIHCDLKAGGQFKVDGTQISSSALSNDSSIIKTGTAFDGRLQQDATYSGTANTLQETEISTLTTTGNIIIAPGAVDVFQGSVVSGKGVFDRLEALEDPIPSLNSNSSLEQPYLHSGYTRLQQVMKPADQDFTQIFKVIFHQLKCAGGFMNNDHLTGLGNSAKPKSFRYNSSVQPVLLGTNTNDMNTFTKQSNPGNATVNSISIDFGASDYDDQLNSFTTGVGYINWGHPGWFEDETNTSNIRNKQNKICWLGTRADDAVNVSIDGVRIAATKYIGSESVSGTGNDDVFHMFVARGEISCLEIMYVGSRIDNNNNTNSVELDFGVIGAF